MKKLLMAAGMAHVLFFVSCATTNQNDTKTPPVIKEAPVIAPVSAPMPAFSLNKLGGGTLASTELAGKPLMINFWHPA